MENKVISINQSNINYEYTCQMCGQIFLSIEELTQHMLNNHVTKKLSNNNQLEELKNILENTYQDYKISIINSNSERHKYSINLLSKEGTDISQRYITYDDALEYSSITPNNIEDLLLSIDNKIKIIEHIEGELLKTNKFEYIKCGYFSYGNSDYEEHFDFKFKLFNEEMEYREKFYYYQKDANEFIQQFKQYYETKLEGEVEKIDESGYLLGYKIGGIDIDGIINRAKLLGKQLRLEII